MLLDRPTTNVLTIQMSETEVGRLKRSVANNPRRGGLQDHDRRILVRLVGNAFDPAAVERDLFTHIVGCPKRVPYIGSNPRRKTRAFCLPQCHGKRARIVDGIVGTLVVLTEPKLIERTVKHASRYGDGGFQNRYGGRARYGKCEV